ncbi:MAG: tRNA (adenosine(37)-N6)-threonylcarbamoyltransferase complex transferase subunit TsaD [Pseudomonadota bacterium]
MDKPIGNSSPILGIETSCDETAAAVVVRDESGKPKILSNIVLSQIDDHAEFGGVVPEIAARAHLSALDGIIQTALNKAEIELDDVSGIGVTSGPGLIGGLMVGLMTAKAIAASKSIPFIGVNHLEGHALTARLTNNIPYPYMLLLVSGGHSQLLLVEGLGKYKRIATTIDDAVGETFDKTAKLLGLGFPGGPNIEKAAVNGDANRFRFPKPLSGKETLNMSFSGLKTAIRQEAQKHAPLSEQDISDLCASMQSVVAKILENRCERAMAANHQIETLVVAGGVAANSEIRDRLSNLCARNSWQLVAPPIKLCTDNAAMIAWAALEHLEKGECSQLNISARSRWPLDQDSTTVVGSGRKGAKV